MRKSLGSAIFGLVVFLIGAAVVAAVFISKRGCPFCCDDYDDEFDFDFDCEDCDDYCCGCDIEEDDDSYSIEETVVLDEEEEPAQEK